VVGNAVRQLQHLVTDEACVECYDLFLSESKMNGTGGNCGSAAERQIPELIYQKKAEKLLTDENCMKIILVRINLLSSQLLTLTSIDPFISLLKACIRNWAFVHFCHGKED